MKAKYFKKIRSQVKWYKVSHRDNLLFSFSDEKEILRNCDIAGKYVRIN